MTPTLTISPIARLRRRLTLGATLSLVAFAAACGGADGGPTGPGGAGGDEGDGGSGSGGRVPAELVGQWYQGNVSSTDFYNSSTGEFASPSGNGVAYTFTADGHYSHVGVIQSSLYGCSSTVLGFDKGTVAVDGTELTLTSTSGRIKSEDTCVADYNYEKSIEIDETVVTYEVGTDESGTETLSLRWPNDQVVTFRRQQ